jgi:hypothetical protein
MIAEDRPIGWQSGPLLLALAACDWFRAGLAWANAKHNWFSGTAVWHWPQRQARLKWSGTLQAGKAAR